MSNMPEKIDLANLFVILFTFFLFVLALFTKGLSHDIFLEVAVFLVSVKLILSTYHNKLLGKALLDKLTKIEQELNKPKS